MWSARLLCAALGAGAWGYWWRAASRLSPRDAFLLWCLTLVLWLLAFASTWPVPRPSRTTAWTAIVVALLLIPRTVWLTDMPYTFTVDETSFPRQGLDVLDQHPWEIMSGAHYVHITYLGEVLQAWPCLFFEGVFGARLASVLLAIGSLLSTYALAGRLFGRATAAISGTVLGCSYWHMWYSRVGYPCMQPMLVVPCALHVLACGTAERNRFLQFLGGILLGASLLVYTPARIVILVAGLWFAHRMLVGAERRRDAVVGALVVALGAAICLTPHLARQGSGAVLQRFHEASASGIGPVERLRAAGWSVAAGQQLLAGQLREAVRPYSSGGGVVAPHDYSIDPMIDPISLALALFGLCVAASHLGDSRHFLLVAWVVSTFVLGQLLTDIPASAYRAAPLLPALAICAGLGLSTIATRVRRWLSYDRPLVRVVALLALVAVLLPSNLRYLRNNLARSASNPGAGMGRLIEAGSPTAVYYLVSGVPLSLQPIFQFLGRGKTMRDVPNLMDSLGVDIDPTRDAVFVFEPSMADAAAAIHRCYPGATLLNEPSGPRDQPVFAIAVPQFAVAAGHDCMAPAQGPGLRARYFADSAWDGPVVMDRIEDWPVRFRQSLNRFKSIEWSGFLQIVAPGDYQFQLRGELATGVATIGASTRVAPGEIATAHLTAGAYPLTVRCRPDHAAGSCWLRWLPVGGAWGTIPPASLMPQPPGAGHQ